jgi:hypothetical protein
MMAVIASGALFGPAGEEIRAEGDLRDFFDRLRGWYGHNPDLLAEIERYDPRVTGEGCPPSPGVPVPALPDFADFDLGLSQRTHFETFRVFSPWVPFERRGAGLPPQFEIPDTLPVDGEGFQPLAFADGLGGSFAPTAATLTGPETVDTEGWLAADTELPFSVRFANDPASGTHVN